MKLSELIVDVFPNDITAPIAADTITARLHECVKDLEWESAEDDCFVICDLGYRQYHLCVCDTLELSCHYVWRASYVEGRAADVYVGHGTYVEAKAAAQAHYAKASVEAFQ